MAELPVPGDNRRVAGMFGRVAGSYDLLNHMLSAGLDIAWRRAMVRALLAPGLPLGPILDLAAGTLDVSIAVARRCKRPILAADVCAPMLLAGLGKLGEAERRRCWRRRGRGRQGRLFLHGQVGGGQRQRRSGQQGLVQRGRLPRRRPPGRGPDGLGSLPSSLSKFFITAIIVTISITVSFPVFSDPGAAAFSNKKRKKRMKKKAKKNDPPTPTSANFFREKKKIVYLPSLCICALLSFRDQRLAFFSTPDTCFAFFSARFRSVLFREE